jgi:hypothetical protein
MIMIMIIIMYKHVQLSQLWSSEENSTLLIIIGKLTIFKLKVTTTNKL